jgi:signal transduction histidine kinase
MNKRLESSSVVRALPLKSSVSPRLGALTEERQAHRRELQALSRKLLDAQEAARLHLSCELHDDIGQILTGLGLLLDRTATNASDVPTLQGFPQGTVAVQRGTRMCVELPLRTKKKVSLK